MALIVGDVHGNLAKTQAFLEWKPEVQHIFVGDFMDSYTASDDEIVRCLQEALDSNSIILSGNHDNQYYRNAGRFTMCSGYRFGSSEIFVHLIESNKDRFKACHVVDNYFVCHGGISEQFGSNFNTIEDIEEFCNKEFDQFKNTPVPQTIGSIIFNVGRNRGGCDMFNGIFWASIGMEQFDTRFNQVVGHTHREEPKIFSYINDNSVVKHVGVDCPQYICYNTETHQLEDFMPERFKEERWKFETRF